MPGFNIGGGGEVSNTVETRRKHRWIFETLPPLGRNVLLLLKTASRPKFILEEPVIHHDQEQAYFAGKQSWEPINMSFYDAEQDPDSSEAIWKWIAGGSGVANVASATVNLPSVYKQNATLTMTDHAGQQSESWSIKGAWPKEANWGDLDYENTEITLIEVVLRFDRALRTA